MDKLRRRREALSSPLPSFVINPMSHSKKKKTRGKVKKIQSISKGTEAILYTFMDRVAFKTSEEICIIFFEHASKLCVDPRLARMGGAKLFSSLNLDFFFVRCFPPARQLGQHEVTALPPVSTAVKKGWRKHGLWED